MIKCIAKLRVSNVCGLESVTHLFSIVGDCSKPCKEDWNDLQRSKMSLIPWETAMLLESTFVLTTPSYHFLFTMLYLEALNSNWAAPRGHILLALSLGGSPSLSCMLFLHGSFFLIFPSSWSSSHQPPAWEANPTYVSFAQLLAVSIFIYQSQLTGGSLI